MLSSLILNPCFEIIFVIVHCPHQVEAQLKQKEDQGDTLQSIDFHQLQIENSQYNQKIEERNQELLELKKTTGRTIQALNAAKQVLYGDLEDGNDVTYFSAIACL